MEILHLDQITPDAVDPLEVEIPGSQRNDPLHVDNYGTS